MELYQVALDWGVPSLIVGLIAYLLHRLKKNTNDTNTVKLGVQALLRSQLYADYHKYREKGYAPLYARQNFENMWEQYHNLGNNGVMDDYHDKFMALPEKLEEE